MGLIKTTRTVSKAKMYRLNKQNPIVKKLMDLDDAISEYYAQKYCDPEAMDEYGNGLPADKKNKPNELLLA